MAPFSSRCSWATSLQTRLAFFSSAVGILPRPGRTRSCAAWPRMDRRGPPCGKSDGLGVPGGAGMRKGRGAQAAGRRGAGGRSGRTPPSLPRRTCYLGARCGPAAPGGRSGRTPPDEHGRGPGMPPKTTSKPLPIWGGGERGQPAQDGGGRGRPLQAAQSRARAAGAACQGRAAAAAFSRAAWALSSLPGTSQSMASSTRCERSVTRTGPIGDSSASAHSAMRPAAAACLLR